jgi:hypothetical protein
VRGRAGEGPAMVVEPGYEVWVAPRNRPEAGFVPGMTGRRRRERFRVPGNVLARSRGRGCADPGQRGDVVAVPASTGRGMKCSGAAMSGQK